MYRWRAQMQWERLYKEKESLQEEGRIIKKGLEVIEYHLVSNT